ncbi:hypothetical protein Bra3105_02345 [Brachybacterium halotolerans subsp. kimchii]|uniref:hypothetical protein n=1 Tax=Brachybacterium halotolerans TaxID=2795215 RepID=UPI001E3AE9E0|nr:hypothetical protein [Brachybacterium halotolerans]UEJ83187.1 hypothetical protein Bra3105_02345 [Brachybacterium halotolerans subsp. kimchii]
MTSSFNPPPHWPEPPEDGWLPPEGWRPDPRWGRVPAGWRVWMDRARAGGAEDGPLLLSEDVPASGARVRRRIPSYPVTVMNPGIWSENQLEHEDYGFPEPAERRARPRLRLGMTIVATVVGLLIAAGTAVLFVQLMQYATDSLPATSLPASSLSAAPAAPTAPTSLAEVTTAA